MKYHIRGKNQTVILSDSDFIEAGGEGKVYKYGNKVCKIYIDPNNMIPDGKISELTRLTRPNIINPEDVLTDSNGKPVGFTMRAVDGYALCELFTNGFRNDNNITDPTIQNIVKIITDTISFIHGNKCLIVDGNELSYIVSRKFDDVFLIDVDSYQTPSYKPTAIHPNTRDIHSNTYSELTDWFGAAIVICWLYVGIHPYRGRHPKYKKKGVEGLEERMRDNISIFNKSVRITSKARGVDCIPSNYKGWFIDLFENGNRCPPPGLPGRVIITPVYTKIVNGTNNFDIALLREFKGEILSYKKVFGSNIVVTKDSSKQEPEYECFINNNRTAVSKENMDVVLSKISLTPIYVKQVADVINFHNDGHSDKSYGIHFGQSKFVCGNMTYIRNGRKLNSIEPMEAQFKDSSKIIVAKANSWSIMPNSSKMLDGFLYQKALEKSFLYVPIPSKNQCVVIKVPELESYRIVNGKYGNHVAMLIGRKGSVYHKLIFRFSDDLNTYDCRIIEDVDIDSINFAVLDNGICISMETSNTLELFRNIPNDSGLNSITDPDIKPSIKLWSDGTRILFSDSNKLYSIKMRK